MVVCPTCREVNEEGRALCQKCGSSLEPGTVALMPRREHGERPPIEVRKPPQPSKWRPLILLGMLVGVGVVVAAFVALRPDPCGGTNFESENFGYCIVVPEGWEAGPAQFGADVTLDQFAPPTGSATVVVEAVDLETGIGLNQWSEFVRQRDEDAGLIPGPASDAKLDGADALQWDVSVASEGGDSFLMREVVTVSGNVGWRVTLNDLQDGFDTSAVVFRGHARLVAVRVDSALELVPQHPHVDDVPPPAVQQDVLAPTALVAEPELLVQLHRALVETAGREPYAVQVELVEGVAQRELGHLPAVALTPVVLPIDRQAELRVPVGVVDVHHPDAADQSVVGDRARREVDRPGRRLHPLLEPLLGARPVHRPDRPEPREPRAHRVVEPGREDLGIGLRLDRGEPTSSPR